MKIGGCMDGWTDGVIWCTDSFRVCPLSSINTGSPLRSHCFLCPDTIYNYLQVQWISHTVAPLLLSSQRRNLIHASVEMIRRVFIKPPRAYLVGAVFSDGLLVNCMLTCVMVPKWDTFTFSTDIWHIPKSQVLMKNAMKSFRLTLNEWLALGTSYEKSVDELEF